MICQLTELSVCKFNSRLSNKTLPRRLVQQCLRLRLVHPLPPLRRLLTSSSVAQVVATYGVRFLKIFPDYESWRLANWNTAHYEELMKPIIVYNQAMTNPSLITVSGGGSKYHHIKVRRIYSWPNSPRQRRGILRSELCRHYTIKTTTAHDGHRPPARRGYKELQANETSI